MNHKPHLIALTALLLNAASVSHGQTWNSENVLLPSPTYAPDGGGRAVLIDPFSASSAPGLLLAGGVATAGSASILRLTPLDASGTSYSETDLDGSLTFVSRLAYNGDRLYAGGNTPIDPTARNLTYVWKVRSSPQGIAGTWIDEDTVILAKNSFSAAWGLATNQAGNVFVSGVAVDSKSPHWIVRRKSPNLGWATVFDAKGNNINMLPAIGVFLGNAINPAPAVFTVADLNSKWTVMRSQNNGASGTWQQVDSWTGGGTAASAFDVIYDGYSGNIYVLGCRGLNGNLSQPMSGWVVRMSPDGGNSWSTLLDTATPHSWAARATVDASGAVSVSGVINPTATSTTPGTPLWKIIRCTNPQAPSAWTLSFAQTDTLPFGSQTWSKGHGLVADAQGNVLATGDLGDWTDDSTTPATVYSGARIPLVRMVPIQPTP